MPGSAEIALFPAQQKARNQLAGLIGARNVVGRTLCCLVGAQGCGKTMLAKHISSDPEFGEARRIPVNLLVLDLLRDKYPDIFGFPEPSFRAEIRRWGRSLQDDVAYLIRERMLAEGLNVLDHLELLFALRLNPVTMWYADAVGRRRILLVITGRMSGQRCQVGSYTLTRADQPIVELEETE
jgi:hypothetical protein